jgi:hypothetical protein
MCLNFTYEVVGQRRKINVILFFDRIILNIFSELVIKISARISKTPCITIGVHLNLSSKLALKSRLKTHHSSVFRVKTQTMQNVRLDLNS